MAQDQYTPEEKLLKVIENSDARGHLDPLDAKSVQQKSWEDMPGIKIIFDAVSGFLTKEGLFNLYAVKTVLIAIAVLTTVIFVFIFMVDRMNFEKRFDMTVNGKVEAQNPETPQKIKVDLVSALETVKKRNVFALGKEQPKPVEAKETAPKSLTSLKLVGILWSADPEAVIEDSAGKKTYMSRAGDSVDRWKIKQIFQNKVILEDGQGEWELK